MGVGGDGGIKGKENVVHGSGGRGRKEQQKSGEERTRIDHTRRLLEVFLHHHHHT